MPDLSPLTIDAAKFAPQGGDPPTTFPEGDPEPSYCSNQMSGGPILPDDPTSEVLPTKGAVDMAKRWEDVPRLQVAFLNAGTVWGDCIAQSVRNIAPFWSRYADIAFDFDRPTAHITVNVAPIPHLGIGVGVYNSALGTDSLAFIQGLFQGGPRPSMNLVFNPAFANSPSQMQQEFQRVILHEFGHALGFIHEHQRPDRPITWNVAAANRFYGAPPNNWNAQTVQEQIINVHQPRGAIAAGSFDVASIMMYLFPAGLASYSDGQPFVSGNNITLSPADKVLANIVYPKRGVAQLAEETLSVGAAPKAGAIATGGQVARHLFRPQSPGVYAFKTEGETPLLLSVQEGRGIPRGRLFAVEGKALNQPIRLTKTVDYFVDVRHALPLTGTGDFKVSVQKVG